MALRTSVGTGDWSVAGTWDTGVPVNGDTFAIAAGHTVTFDVDQSAMGSGMGASSIAATGQLTIKDDGGTYYLKMNGDLTLNGTMQAGTSIAVPLTSTFTIDFNGGSNSIVGSATGIINLYCAQPTNQFVRLADTEPAAETEMDNLTTDVSSDIWAVGDTVQIIDDVAAASIDTESATINAIIATKITLNAGLGAEKTDGAWLVLVTRNIMVQNGTDYAFKTCDNSAISCAITTSSAAYACDNTTFTGCVMDSTVACINSCAGSTFTECLMIAGDSSMYGINTSEGSNAFTDCYFLGNRNGIYTVVGDTFTTCTFSAAYIMSHVANCAFNSCVFEQVTYMFSNSANNVYSACSWSNTLYGVYLSNANVMYNCTTTGVTTFFNDSYGNLVYNCDFSGSTTENSGYNTNKATAYAYTESLDHDQTENAYKAWTKGGIVTSQTASPPTGYTIWYELACESATYPCFRQYETVVLPGTAIEVEGVMRNLDNGDLTGATIELQIIDKFADPLVDSTQSVLDSDAIDELNSAVESGWQDVSVIWANQGDAPRNVIVRMIVDGVVADIDTAWSIADYKDQINETLKRVKRISAGSEFT